MGLWSTVTKIGIDVGKAYYEYDAAKDTQKAANKAADRTAALTELNERALQAESAERERRTLAEQERTEGLARAKAAASGAAMSGSVSGYLSLLEGENLKEYDWMVNSNQSQLEALKASGQSAVSSLRSSAKAYGKSAIGAAIGGIGSVVDTGIAAGGWDGGSAWYKG